MTYNIDTMVEEKQVTVDMTDTNEPAVHPYPANWRVIQEDFPETTGAVGSAHCNCVDNQLP